MEQTRARISHVRFINAEAVHAAVRYLANRCDGAHELDGQGFNKQDSFNGHSWARAARLTDEQAEEAREMVRKYKRQIPDNLWRAMW
jgi:hypothetical protein